MSVEDVVRVKEHSLLAYLKRAEVNSEWVLDIFVKEKKKTKLITKQKQMMLDGWCDKPLHKQCSSRTGEKGMSCWRW